VKQYLWSSGQSDEEPADSASWLSYYPPTATTDHQELKLFQEDNGIPVHLKGGVADALLYRATMILTVGGTAYAIYQLAMASFPKKQD